MPGAVVKVVGTHLDMSASTEKTKLKVMECIHKQTDDYKAYLATERVKVIKIIRSTQSRNRKRDVLRAEYNFAFQNIV